MTELVKVMSTHGMEVSAGRKLHTWMPSWARSMPSAYPGSAYVNYIFLALSCRTPSTGPDVRSSLVHVRVTALWLAPFIWVGVTRYSWLCCRFCFEKWKSQRFWQCISLGCIGGASRLHEAWK